MKALVCVLLLLSALLLQACASTLASRESREKAAQYNAQLGINYMNKQGDLEQARIKLEKALDQDGNNALANVGYAQLQALVGDKTLANTHYRRAIELEPLNASHRNAYGVFLCGEDKVAEAIREFDSAVENRYYKTPEFALDNAGVCLLDAGRTAQAETYLVEAVKTNARYAPALLNLADLHFQLKRMDLAAAYFQRYEKLGKETPRSLWTGYRIMRANGDKNKATQLSDSLLRNYPNSKQAGELLTTNIDD